MKRDFIEELTWRRMLSQKIEGVDQLLNSEVVSGYIGFDGSINMAFLLGNGLSVQCPRLVNLSGSCDINNTAGVKVGTATP